MPQAEDYPDEVEVYVEGRFMLVSRERAELLTEYEEELDRLLSVVEYGRARVLNALGLKECACAECLECDEWCCRG